MKKMIVVLTKVSIVKAIKLTEIKNDYGNFKNSVSLTNNTFQFIYKLSLLVKAYESRLSSESFIPKKH